MKTVNKKILKKSWGFILLSILTLTLVACGNKKSSIPFGSLTDKVYASTDGFEITEKELYEEMRFSGTQTLTKMLHEVLYKDELTKVSNKETFKDDYLYYVNKAIFGQTEMDALKEIPEAMLNKNVESYIDAMSLLGVTITLADIDSENFNNHNDKVLDYYKLDVAKRVYAREKLEEEVLDTDSTNYIDKDVDLGNYFDNNIKKRYPLSYISVRFSNLYESEATLRKHSIKAHVGKWYVIPDPRVDIVEGYALTVLEKLDLEEKNGTGELTESEYKLYYNDYKVNPERPILEGPDTALTIDEALNMLLVIYNETYPYKEQIDVSLYPTLQSLLDDSTYVNNGEEKGLFTLEYDDWKISSRNQLSSVRNYLYNTLTTDEDGVRFTAQPRSFGNYYYILFKLADHNEDVKAQLNNEDQLKVYEDDGIILTTYAEEYFHKIKESKLTDAYVNELATKRLDEAEVQFYDEELHLILRNEKFKMAKKSSKDIVAKINDVEIKVDTFYERLEKQLGVSTAMDLAVSKALLNSDYRNRVTDEEIAEYRTNIENMIRNFSNDAFKGSGFPKEMGRAKFLKLAFRANSIDEAIENIYIKTDVENLYLEDLEAHYGEEIYEKLALYANRLREQYFSLSQSHFLIHVDMDEDENPDKPHEFFETLSEEKRASYRSKVTEFMQVVHDEASQYSNIADGLRAIAEDFKKSSKIKPDNCNTLEGKNDPSCKWADFKKEGFQVLFESMNPTTNQTNYPDKSSKLDDKFYERIMEIYAEVKTEYYDIDKSFPTNKLDNRPSLYEDLLETDFGWHLILTTGGSVAHSAKFTIDDDIKYRDSDAYKIYEHIILKDKDGNDLPALDAYSDTDAISANQVKIYIYQTNSEEGTVTLPTNVKQALENYLNPILAKYENNFTKLHLLNKYLLSQNFKFATTDNTARFNNLVTVNENQFFLYARTHEMYMEIYGDWFTTFE